MKRTTLGITIGLLFTGGIAAGCAPGPPPQHKDVDASAGASPSATQNLADDIVALTPQQIDDLLQGRGANLALAAECNDSPGPMHVIELADQLRLSPDQRKLTRELAGRMGAEARDLGRRVVDVEQALDNDFRSGTMNAERLASLTGTSASLGGQLRNVHLRTHLEMRAALTEDQIDIYYVSRRDSGKCTP